MPGHRRIKLPGLTRLAAMSTISSVVPNTNLVTRMISVGVNQSILRKEVLVRVLFLPRWLACQIYIAILQNRFLSCISFPFSGLVRVLML
jgi:hypothetical protein